MTTAYPAHVTAVTLINAFQAASRSTGFHNDFPFTSDHCMDVWVRAGWHQGQWL